MAESSLSSFEENVVNNELVQSFENHCDICGAGKKTVADGYCQQCGQHLCTNCCLQHGKIVGTKHHTIRGKDTDAPTSRSFFGRKLIPSSEVTVPALPSKGNPSETRIKYVQFFKDTDMMIVLCWYPKTEYYAISELREGEQRRYSIGLLDESLICLDMEHSQIILASPSSNGSVVSVLDIDKPFFSKREMFKTTGACRAIVEFDNGFAVAIQMSTKNFSVSPWQIQYLDRIGNIKNRLSYDKDGNALFDNPTFLASNYNQNILYVVDAGRPNIIVFNIAGELLFTFSSNDMATPRSITTDMEGNIYVACKDKILQVAKDGKEHNVAMKNSSQPCDNVVAFNFEKERLVVSDGISPNLQCLTFM